MHVLPRSVETSGVGVGHGKPDMRGRVAGIQTNGILELPDRFRPSAFEVERVTKLRVRGSVVRARRDGAPCERFGERRLPQLHGELGEHNPSIGLAFALWAQRPQDADRLGAIAGRAKRTDEIVAGLIGAYSGVERAAEMRDRFTARPASR